ncbi:MAG TPA: LuxR C-terminal-related transcriptional regulator [Candidatus Yaniella excrementigallinarum]|nr:LuxR C-terminal-related transcriptional regulator [Candidatus Yaniella excrementigallinarum]
MPQTAVTLTPRETEILKHLVQRRTRAQIAQKLFISPNTVKTQLRSIFRKPGVSSASGAVREGRRRGIL